MIPWPDRQRKTDEVHLVTKIVIVVVSEYIHIYWGIGKELKLATKKGEGDGGASLFTKKLSTNPNLPS